mmetsp:Transcript_34819/g.84145  ORF Transcript_34819/g.84145 Transcript_34819/m.84145 type:complete len:285 (+) Transcript_34819:38-892(+)
MLEEELDTEELSIDPHEKHERPLSKGALHAPTAPILDRLSTIQPQSQPIRIPPIQIIFLQQLLPHESQPILVQIHRRPVRDLRFQPYGLASHLLHTANGPLDQRRADSRATVGVLHGEHSDVSRVHLVDVCGCIAVALRCIAVVIAAGVSRLVGGVRSDTVIALRRIAITNVNFTYHTSDRTSIFRRPPRFCLFASVAIVGVGWHGKDAELGPPMQKIAIRENGIRLAQILPHQAHHVLQLLLVDVIDKIDSFDGGHCDFSCSRIIASFILFDCSRHIARCFDR